MIINMNRRILVYIFLLSLISANELGAQTGNLTRTFPHPSLAPLDVVRIVMTALQKNDERGANSGIAITFNFASPANKRVTGPLARFTSMLNGPLYGDMLNHKGALYENFSMEGKKARVDVIIRTVSGNFKGFRFRLSRQRGNIYEGSWMTDAVMPIDVTAI